MSDAPKVLITGGAKRIGSALCTAFAHHGWHVIIHTVQSVDAARALAQRLGHNVSIARADLSYPMQVDAFAKNIAAQHGHIHCLINNASIFEPDTNDESLIARMMMVNALAPKMLMDYFSAIQKKITVINLLDYGLTNPQKKFSYYYGSKALLQFYTHQAQAFWGDAARVYGIAPGPTLPSPRQSSAHFQQLCAHTSHKRATRLSEVTEAALLCTRGDIRSGHIFWLDGREDAETRPVIDRC
ncbi:MAG: SDR family NAD(P)-dependent oxidoreductase [Alphaproteobacteria bacterium]|nr:SDR family NAD(P)-dependent oxidoreductase [Alphaproteobacteria bacterium]NDC55763.1 SDR family NAD(P)-dependent oxidoreductase [Alphaproteobacteria bacterium]NDG04172.1 SDR family NAD(P)-dependent oxidoreductase [Alphaproteobacteria bacterium]